MKWSMWEVLPTLVGYLLGLSLGTHMLVTGEAGISRGGGIAPAWETRLVGAVFTAVFLTLLFTQAYGWLKRR